MLRGSPLSLCSSGCGRDPPCIGLRLFLHAKLSHLILHKSTPTLFNMPDPCSPRDTVDFRDLLFWNQFDPDLRQVDQQFLGNRIDGVTACIPTSTSFGRTAERIPTATPHTKRRTGTPATDLRRPLENGLQFAWLETRTTTIPMRLSCLSLGREDRRSLHWKTRATPLRHTLRTATFQDGSGGRTPR